MKISTVNEWNVSPSEAVSLQKQLRERVQLQPYPGLPRLIAGADISFNLYSSTFFAAFVVLDMKSMEIVDRSSAIIDVQFPYIPGLLSFREIPALIHAWEKLSTEPDVVVFDGQGIAHPRRLGIASHMGLFIEKPTIGCGKSKLIGQFQEPVDEPGAQSDLVDRGEKIGTVLKTKRRSNPLFISPGHLMDFESSVRIMMAAVRGYRIPEPTRQAHIYVNELRREALAQ